MLESIAAAIAPVSEALTSPAYLQRDGATHRVRMNPHGQVKPPRAAHSGRSFDVRFRMHNDGFEPRQNDHVSMDGGRWWIVWRILPSPLGSYYMLECMAPPADIVIPAVQVRTPDGIGGWTVEDTLDSSAAFPATVHSGSTERMLTAQTEAELGRIAIGYWVQQANVKAGDRLFIRGDTYTVLAVSTDDENPAWGRAVLAREA